jgi:hypothetical protein
MARHSTPKKHSKRKSTRLRAAVKPAPQPQLSKEQKHHARWRLRSPKRLVRAIFSRIDPVEVGRTLLDKSGDATKAKTFFQLLEYLYDKPGAEPEASGPEAEKAPFRFVTHVPRPQRTVDRNSEDQQNKEMCRTSLSGAAGAGRTVASNSDQEDEND